MNKKSVMRQTIDETVNDQQLLEIALFIMARTSDSDNIPAREFAGHIVGAYTLEQVTKGKDEFTEEEFTDVFNDVITQYVLTDMVKDGLMEVDFGKDNITYRATEKGIDSIILKATDPNDGKWVALYDEEDNIPKLDNEEE